MKLVSFAASASLLAVASLPAFSSSGVIDPWTPFPRVGANAEWWQREHLRLCALSRAKQPKVLFLGDSITLGWIMAGKPVWDQYFANLPSANLGIGGDSTQSLLWRLLNGALEGVSPKVVVLMIGTNNLSEYSAQDVARGVAANLSAIHTKLPKAKVVLLAILPRTKGSAKTIQKVVKVDALMQKFPRDWMLYTDLSKGFFDKNGHLVPGMEVDGLHPSLLGYSAMALRLGPLVGKLCAQSNEATGSERK